MSDRASESESGVQRSLPNFGILPGLIHCDRLVVVVLGLPKRVANLAAERIHATGWSCRALDTRTRTRRPAMFGPYVSMPGLGGYKPA